MAKFAADAVRDLAESDIRAMTRECARVGGINLGQGICKLPVDPRVLDAAAAALRGDHHGYTVAEGTAALRAAIAAKLCAQNGIDANPETEITVTAGTTAAYTSALLALLNRGDSILFLDPFYGYHVGIASLLGFKPRFVERAGPRFRLRAEALRAAFAPGTRAIVLCTPCNPTGRMLDQSELSAVAAFAEEHDLLVLTDEIYEHVRFDGREHISPASVPGLFERTVSILGLSKTYSVTGWRLGYAVAPAEMTRLIRLTHDLGYICAPSPLQAAAVTALSLPADYYEKLAEAYQKRRDRICDALSAAGLTPVVPEGSYFVLADIAHLGFATSKAAAMALLEESRVAAVPGSAFFRGPEGERYLRFCFAVGDRELDEACERLVRSKLRAPAGAGRK